MHITIDSPSPAVLRNVRAIVERAGFTVTPEANQRLVHTPNGLQLLQATTVHELPCPITPRALISALTAGTSTVTLANSWEFDPAARSLRHSEQTHLLTEKETRLLETLLATAPAACSRDHLLKQIWAYEAGIETHTLETHVYRLRQKLEQLHPRPCDIETLDGAYRLTGFRN